ncbi:PPC domain-containing DNA-binding protein [Paraburkholderia phytofirmans]|uniref:PPC domain-containing DNA-binding protein n=1 Tax=Paraburkholderia TaxID=1822464 RepID=UPI0009EE1752|nr:PPC domain-containing DNA-binding protein [Paraburkholderia phytofirmans]
MDTDVVVESGHYGRLVVARLKPNEDLIESLENKCLEHGIGRAIIRGVVGSLVDASLERGHGNTTCEQPISGPGVEILNVFGEIDLRDRAYPNTVLSGIVADTKGQMFAGRFRRGANLSFITIEVSLQEWISD